MINHTIPQPVTQHILIAEARDRSQAHPSTVTSWHTDIWSHSI